MGSIFHLWRKFRNFVGLSIPLFASLFVPEIRYFLGIEKIENGEKVKPIEINNIDSSEVIILMDYLYVFPEKIGEFSDEPHTIINGINNQNKYGFNDWRLPTIQELELICANTSKINNISKREQYMSSTFRSERSRMCLEMGSCDRNDYFSSYSSEKAHVILVRSNNLTVNTSATIEEIWINHNINKNEQTGMNIHVNFSVSGMLNKKGLLVAWFYYSDGTDLIDFNNKYKSSDNNVAVADNFSPSYKNALYEDFILFIPYGELHLENGTQNLKFYVGIFDNDENQITKSDWNYFTITVY